MTQLTLSFTSTGKPDTTRPVIFSDGNALYVGMYAPSAAPYEWIFTDFEFIDCIDSDNNDTEAFRANAMMDKHVVQWAYLPQKP